MSGGKNFHLAPMNSSAVEDCSSILVLQKYNLKRYKNDFKRVKREVEEEE